MRLIIIFLLLSATLYAQQKSTIILGDGSGTPVSGVSDSMGLVIPQGEIVIGTNTKAPYSTDSLLWNAGLFVDAPVNFSALVAGAVDSLLYIDASGFVGKTAGFTDTNFGNTDITFTGNRNHAAGGNSMNISGMSTMTLENNFGESVRLRVNSVDLIGDNVILDGGIINASGTSIILDAPDIILEDPLTLSTWDSILVRHPVTGEIQGRLASTIAGSDSLGRNGTPGQIVFETATKAPDSSPGLFWTGGALGVGTSTVTGKLHVVGSTTLEFLMESIAGNPDMAFAESGNVKAQWKYDITGHRLAAYVDESNSGLVGITTPDFSIYDNGTVVIGTGTIATSAALDIQSTTGSLLLPRMTTTQRDALTAADGMQIYNTTTSKFQGRAGGAWVDLH